MLPNFVSEKDNKKELEREIIEKISSFEIEAVRTADPGKNLR